MEGSGRQSVQDQIRKRPIWASCLVFAWILCLVVLILSHVAISQVIDPILDLPDNIKKGFNDAFKFAHLEEDGQLMMDQSTTAMQTCVTGANPETCDPAPTFNPHFKTSNTATMYREIMTAFNKSLDTIDQVANDKCFGSDDFATVSADIQKIRDAMGLLKVTDQPCIVSWPQYCVIYMAGKDLKAGAADVQTDINDISNNKEVNEFTNEAGDLEYLHALPYALVLSLVFFTLFWYYDVHRPGSRGACCCCRRGKCLGCCCFLTPHLILWLVYVILALVITIIGFLIPDYVDRTNFDIGADPGCKIQELIDHSKEHWPKFYDAALGDLIDGLILFHNAFLGAFVMCLFIGCYGVCLCICRPYAPRVEEDKVQPVVPTEPTVVTAPPVTSPGKPESEEANSLE